MVDYDLWLVRSPVNQTLCEDYILFYYITFYFLLILFLHFQQMLVGVYALSNIKASYLTQICLWILFI